MILRAVIDRLQNTPSDNVHDRYYYDDESGLLYLIASPSNRLCIPRGDLRLALLQEYNDYITAAHPRRDRTSFRLSHFFYWPRMGIDVKRFVKSRVIAANVQRQVRLSQACFSRSQCPLNLGKIFPWILLWVCPVPQEVMMQFTHLWTASQNAFIWFQLLLLLTMRLVSICVLKMCSVCMDLVLLRSSIVCDRDPRFTSAFFQDLFKKLGTKLSFSTVNHPQTDSQSENVNRIIGDVLRAFANHKQDDWDLLLPFCEFSINNSEQSSTCETPFFLNYGLHPRAPADFLSPSSSGPCHDWLQAQAESLRMAQDAIVAAQARQAFYADQKKTPEDLSVGDSVMVHREFLLTPEARSRPSHKLQLKWYGPFNVLQRVGPNAYRLELPHSVWCHPVFNVSAHKKYHQNGIA